MWFPNTPVGGPESTLECGDAPVNVVALEERIHNKDVSESQAGVTGRWIADLVGTDKSDSPRRIIQKPSLHRALREL